MMKTKDIVEHWFACWRSNQYENIPIHDDFEHQSPYGLIQTKSAYMDVIEQNKAMFLDNSIEVMDMLVDGSKAAVRYQVKNSIRTFDVSEWFEIEGDVIKKIWAYYNINEDFSKLKGT